MSSDVEFVHRKLTDGDIYFVDNRSDHDDDDRCHVQAGWQGAGVVASGNRHFGAGVIQGDGRTDHGSSSARTVGHRVCGFSQNHIRSSRTPFPKMTETKVASIGGPWNLAFQEGRGAPESITLNDLSDWSSSERSGSEVLLRYWDIHEDGASFARLVWQRCAALDRSGRRQEPRRSDSQR